MTSEAKIQGTRIWSFCIFFRFSQSLSFSHSFQFTFTFFSVFLKSTVRKYMILYILWILVWLLLSMRYSKDFFFFLSWWSASRNVGRKYPSCLPTLLNIISSWFFFFFSILAIQVRWVTLPSPYSETGCGHNFSCVMWGCLFYFEKNVPYL